jgi:hypothetical protein
MLQTNMFWHRRFNQDEASLWLRETMVRVFGESAEKAAAEAAFLPQ